MASDGLPRARTEDAPLLETVAPLTFNTERASWQRKDYVQDQKSHPQTPHFPDRNSRPSASISPTEALSLILIPPQQHGLEL